MPRTRSHSWLAIFFWMLCRTRTRGSRRSLTRTSCYFLLNVVSTTSLPQPLPQLTTCLLFSFECCPCWQRTFTKNLEVVLLVNLNLAIFFWMLSLSHSLDTSPSPWPMSCYFLLNVVVWGSSRRENNCCYKRLAIFFWMLFNKRLRNPVCESSSWNLAIFFWMLLDLACSTCFSTAISPVYLAIFFWMLSIVAWWPQHLQVLLAIFFWMLYYDGLGWHANHLSLCACYFLLNVVYGLDAVGQGRTARTVIPVNFLLFSFECCERKCCAK